MLCCFVQVVAAARSLMKSGVSSVLVTLSERGAVLVLHNGTIIIQPALPVPGGVVVDGTAAGGGEAGFKGGGRGGGEGGDGWMAQQQLGGGGRGWMAQRQARLAVGVVDGIAALAGRGGRRGVLNGTAAGGGGMRAGAGADARAGAGARAGTKAGAGPGPGRGEWFSSRLVGGRGWMVQQQVECGGLQGLLNQQPPAL